MVCERILVIEEALQKLEAEKTALQEELKRCTASSLSVQGPSPPSYTPAEKIKIFMNLFRGRTDVFPKRWHNIKTGQSGYSPACFHEWVKGQCNKPRIKCSACPNQAFIPLSEDIVRKHLGGEQWMGGRREYTIGIYPMLKDDSCWFLAIDFDKAEWQRDVAAFTHSCRLKHVPFALERSRSGNGAHIWIFFEKPIQASQARKMGSALLTETMQHYPDLGFESYDRFFPHQDTLPLGRFGNLIALPLQHFSREKGNSVFINEAFEPYKDQWMFLASVSKMSEEAVDQIVEEASETGKILGVRLPVEEEGDPWELPPSRKKPAIPVGQDMPSSIHMVISNQIFIEKRLLPPVLITMLIRLAAFQNPAFYAAQSMRLPTFDKPRIIACAENFPHHIALPRGCIDACMALLDALNIQVTIEDKRESGTPIAAQFLGHLSMEQQKAVQALLPHDMGVLAATTAFGKTVVGAHMIAKRQTNTLIIVHRRQLLDQWGERLTSFLNLQPDQIGQIGGGKCHPSGIVDVVTIQSLIKDHIVKDVVGEYGHVIVDECHHVPAVSFEAVIQCCKAKYVLGLTATATRKDGHHPIIFMQCGPIRYRVDAKTHAALQAFAHRVIIRNTAFHLNAAKDGKAIPSINDIYAAMVTDEKRNHAIIDDVVAALNVGRSPLILTERKEHALFLAQSLSKLCKNVILMLGGQNAKKREEVTQQLHRVSEQEERIIIATGRYIGEGFDDARLDTLFLTMPISWHGTLAQYAGRLHRTHSQKKEVLIYDYVDQHMPMLVKMASKRMHGYKKIAYAVDQMDPKL